MQLNLLKDSLAINDYSLGAKNSKTQTRTTRNVTTNQQVEPKMK